MQSTPPVCDYTNSDYQTSFWDQGGRAYEDRAEAVALKRLLSPEGGQRLLELGAGAGRNTLRYTGYQHIVLLDYSETQLQQARQRLGDSERFTYVAADIYRLPFMPASFDGATMIRTLHHMADARRALDQVRLTLQPNATFILEFANKKNLKSIVRYALGRQHWSPFTPEPVEFAALNFDFHPAMVRTWLQLAGFSIERMLTVSHFRIGLFKKLLPTGLLVAMDSVAQLTGNWWQLSPSVFTRCRAVGGQPGPLPPAFFRCPVCGSGPLPAASADEIVCPDCQRHYPVHDGVYDFRVVE
ncbi:methylase [Longilinea arvoryzae]|uniref:Methylase n=1 Tax=Longilinea arvoryzae TaxID=360412 RepID=A0A0S7BCK1_9CHLR|nr:methyltransferase domain-containing protein [Longilinea arvoryzae]GAP12388.1 methylase [Longilinea arvoryzae]